MNDNFSEKDLVELFLLRTTSYFSKNYFCEILTGRNN